MTEQQTEGLRAVQSAGRWRLDGAGPADLPVINEFLGYVADRGYSPRTERAYAFDLLAFARWLVDQDLTVGGVTTDALLRFLTFCRAAVLPGQAGGNVVPLRTGRSTGLVQTYLLAERPESASTALFLVAKGSHRGQPLTPAGLRTVFRYHRAVAGVPAGHPHALRHSFGTALAEAGVDLAVLQALMGHDRVDSSAAYIHLAPTHVRASYDAARARQRADV